MYVMFSYLNQPAAEAVVVHGGDVAGAATRPDERLGARAVVADPTVAGWAHASHQGVGFHILL